MIGQPALPAPKSTEPDYAKLDSALTFEFKHMEVAETRKVIQEKLKDQLSHANDTDLQTKVQNVFDCYDALGTLATYRERLLSR